MPLTGTEEFDSITLCTPLPQGERGISCVAWRRRSRWRSAQKSPLPLWERGADTGIPFCSKAGEGSVKLLRRFGQLGGGLQHVGPDIFLELPEVLAEHRDEL